MIRTTLVSAAVALIALAAPVLADEGIFTGASGHTTTGSVAVVKEGGNIIVKLDGSFSLDNAPDAYIALGRDAKPVEGGIIEELRSWTGEQSYTVPTSSALEAATEVIIWCKQYSVPLGVAKIN